MYQMMIVEVFMTRKFELNPIYFKFGARIFSLLGKKIQISNQL